MGFERCLGCMKQKQGEQRCPFCGFNPKDAVVSDFLPPETRLHEAYLVGKAVQRDGEGITYLGIDHRTGQPVWIREYLPGKLSSREGLSVVMRRGSETHFKTLQSEFIELYQQLLSLKGCEHIITVRDLFRANDTVYAVYTYFEGITLAEYINDHAGELSPEQVTRLFAPFFDAMQTVHQAGIVHRGITPKTLLVAGDKLILTGFSSPALQSVGSEIDPNLSPGYAAPEQYGKMKQHGTWTDVYALSAVLYKALSGTMPPEASMRAVHDNLIPLHQLNGAVPEAMSLAIQRGMNYDIEQRTRTMQVLRAGLYTTNLNDTVTTTAIFGKQQGGRPDDVILYSDNQVNDGEDGGDEDHDTSMALWKKTLFIIAPFLLVVILLLYWLILGQGCSSGGNAKNSSSDVSSEQVSSMEESSEEPTSSETSSEEESTIEQISVDNFVNRRYQDIVTDAAYKNKFKFTAVYDFSATFPQKGTVIEQSVRFGSKVDPGTEITLTVSEGPRFVDIPSLQTLSSWSANDFKTQMENSYLSASISSEKRYSDTVPFGNVVAIEGVIPGTQVDRERSPNIHVIIFESAGVDPNPPQQESEPDQ